MTWPFVPLQPHHYGAILADPPWGFLTYGKQRVTPHRTEADHYATMTMDDLRAMPVADLAARDAALFLWIVDSHVDAGLDLARTWGFKFKTIAFVWDKGGIGMGYWTRKQTECCFLFTRGKPRRLSKGVRQKIVAPRREHSRKPGETHDRIAALVAGPYAELFAREPRLGWDAWGNETRKFSGATVPRKKRPDLREQAGAAVSTAAYGS